MGELFAEIEQQVAKEEADKASSDKLDRLKTLVAEAGGLQEEIEGMVEVLKARIGRFNRIKQYEMPELMKATQTGLYENVDRTIRVKLDSYVSGSLPKEEHDREMAIEYLIDVGGQNLIKSELACEFPKSMHNMAMSILGALNEEIKKLQAEVKAETLAAGGEYEPEDLEPTLKESVNAMSLQAFVRQKLKGGEEIDPQKLGCSTGSIAKFEFYDPATMKKKKKLSLEDL